MSISENLIVEGQTYTYYPLSQCGADVTKLPYSLKVLLENLLRHEGDGTVSPQDVKALVAWTNTRTSTHEISFAPARVLMQDFTGVPAVVDLAAMRQALKKMGGDPQKINPLAQVDLVIDHSVMVDRFGSDDSFRANVEFEFDRNGERYTFLRWGQQAFNNFNVVPPGTGICHQVNLENLAQAVWVKDEGGKKIAMPDTLVGTDSHTTMVNGLGVLGWGVGGIEAEAAMLGQPVSMLIPEVVGFKFTGHMKEGTTATDLVLTVTQILRQKGVVGKFVEFFGPGLSGLTLADRATIANMAPEYGATCGIFPIDQETIDYLTFTGRDPHRVKLTEAYAKAMGLWRTDSDPDPVFTETLTLDLTTVEPSLAGPKRPQDKILLKDASTSSIKSLAQDNKQAGSPVAVSGENFTLDHGHVVIAAITSCTNTSNPMVMVGAGLLARKAIEKGLTSKPWVKTSLAPGSQVVSDYLNAANLQEDLDKIGFNLVGYGCTTCIGNSGPLDDSIAKAIDGNDLNVAAVLSGNRNFEGRVHPQVKLNYLASPPLVVAYALAGSMMIDLSKDSLGTGNDGNPVYLKDIWPTSHEIRDTLKKALTPQMFTKRYANVFDGDQEWQDITVTAGLTYQWEPDSTYVKHPPFFENMKDTPDAITDIMGARPLAILGDSVTTDHISPAGSIKKDSPAGAYLTSHSVDIKDFNSYGSRRGNHEVMMRGTFANIRIQNEMTPGVTGGVTRHMPDGQVMPIYDAAMKYEAEGTPLVIVAGQEYGTGSSRDWAAKGTRLLGVRAVITESFERIHRSNLVGMGILPLTFTDGMNRHTLHLDGSETFDIKGLTGDIKPKMTIECTITRKSGSQETIPLLCRIDTENEVEYFKHGGILHYVLRNLAKAA